MATTDNQLMKRMSGGDMDALSTIVLRHQQGLVGFLTRLAGSREAAEDLAQETFLRVYRSRQRYQPSGRFTTWLFTIAYRLHLDARRAWNTSHTTSVETRAIELVDRTSTTPESATISRDISRRVQTEIDALPDQYRPVMILRSRQDLSYAEIGVVVGCSEGAARVKMHKGLALLRKRLKAAGLLGQSIGEKKS